jgi:hypothetical protein
MKSTVLSRLHTLQIAAAGMMILLLVLVAGAAGPSRVNYQGVLTRIDGTPLDTLVFVQFFLFNNSVGGGSIWREEHRNVIVTDGNFSAQLGETTPLSPAILNHDSLWLGVQIGNNAEMTPRLRLGTVPYTQRTATIDDASGGAVNGDVMILGNAVIGFEHECLGAGSFVAGYRNHALDDYTSVSGGDSNYAFGSHATVGGGYRNIAVSDYSIVGGGHSNTAGLLEMRTGGTRSPGDGDYAAVSGGLNNVASGDYSAISGGRSNQAQGPYAVVSGGHFNTASDSAAITGGTYNVAGPSAVIGGGNNNSAGGAYAFIGGGSRNQADSAFAVVPGGSNCVAGRYSFAAGRRAKAYLDGCFRWADDFTADFSAPDTANSFSVRARGGVHLFTNSGLTSGAHLYAGSSTWYAVSDSTQKKNIRTVDTQTILSLVERLPVKRWSYTSQDAGIEHIGPMAQDFWTLFHVGDDSLSISTIDPAGIALAAIQELAKQNQALRQELADVQAKLRILMAVDNKAVPKEKE